MVRGTCPVGKHLGYVLDSEVSAVQVKCCVEMFTVMHIMILIPCMYNASNSFCTDQESLLKKC